MVDPRAFIALSSVCLALAACAGTPRVGPPPRASAIEVPTDLQIAADGSLYVLEFCDAFVDPVARREELVTRALHGGFRRFSGRLLHIDRQSGAVTVVADGLDTPTNLTQTGGALLVAEGMGTPGRLIPGPNGQPVALTGFIERISVPTTTPAPALVAK